MNIPDKLTFKRNEVIKIARLDGKVLDYWQKEFGGFVPIVNRMGEKFYTRKNLELILKIKQWMIVEKIAKTGVKERIAQGLEHQPEHDHVPGEGTVTEPGASADTDTVQTEKVKQTARDKLKIIRQNLQDILTILDKNDK